MEKKSMRNFEIIFESERIYFVKLSEELVQEYLTMVNDIEVQKYISHERKEYTLHQEIEWVKNKLKENAVIFSMIEKDTGSYIGNIEIMDINNNVGELGIAITPKQQDKHFGQESIKAIIDYAFDKLKLDSLDLNVYSFNPRAIHCYEKVGFEILGNGKEKDDIHMKISR